MKLVLPIAVVAAAYACAQTKPQTNVSPALQVAQPPAKPAAPPAGATPAAAPAPKAPSPKSNITRKTLKPLEDAFNMTLGTFNPSEPVYMLGTTRGVYLQTYGAVFSAELDLIQSPTVNPFHSKILPEEVTSTHARKVKQLPTLGKAVIMQMMACAKSLDAVPMNEQIVFAIRLDYQGWEDTTDLPTQLLLHADRKSAISGDVQVDKQF